MALNVENFGSVLSTKFPCQWAILEHHCVNWQTSKSFRYHKEHYICEEW